MANRYWVGGTGNWTDTGHWSTTSNGTPGASVPTSSDDVFIDPYSFSSNSDVLTIDTATATCANLTIASSYSAQIYGTGVSSSVLTCTGNFTRSGAIANFSNLGTIIFDSSSTTSVKSIVSFIQATWTAVIVGNKTISGGFTVNDLTVGDPTVATSANTYVFSVSTVSAKNVTLNGGNITIGNIDLGGTGGTLTVNTSGTFTPVITQSGNVYVQNNSTLTLGASSSQRVNIEVISFVTPIVTINANGASSGTYIGTLIAPKGTFRFQASKTHDVSSFSFSTSTVKTFESSSSGTQYTLSSGTAGDTRSFSSLNVKDCIAAGATYWNAPVNNGCVDSGNNVNWNFAPMSVNAFMQFF